MHGQAVQLARQTHGKIADVDHFLHFAVAFRLDLAHFKGHQRTERIFVGAQGVGTQTDGFAAFRGRGRPPHGVGGFGAGDEGVVIALAGGVNAADDFAGARVDRFKDAGIGGFGPLAVAEVGAGFGVGKAEGGENGVRHDNSKLG